MPKRVSSTAKLDGVMPISLMIDPTCSKSADVRDECHLIIIMTLPAGRPRACDS